MNFGVAHLVHCNPLCNRDKKSNTLPIVVDYLYIKYSTHLFYSPEMKSTDSMANPQVCKCSCLTTVEDISEYSDVCLSCKTPGTGQLILQTKMGVLHWQLKSHESVAIGDGIFRNGEQLLVMLSQKRMQCCFNLHGYPNGIHCILKVCKK